MEKPDANGFVNITWPSKNIPHGGVFHTRIVEPSTEQQKFLKVLLEESKLTIAQRRKSAFKLREQDENVQEVPQQEYKPLVRPHTSRRRSLSCIRESGVYDMDPYKPVKRGEDREKLKERLAIQMEYGDSPEPTPPPPPRVAKPAPKLPTAKEKWSELLTQIRERAEWLAEMEHLGHAEPHREIVQEQIAERLRALDALGIDSKCSSARSEDSGFSTVRSREPVATVRSKGSSAKSVRSTGSHEKPKQGSARIQSKFESGHGKREESVTDYEKHSPLQYTPRRRV